MYATDTNKTINGMSMLIVADCCILGDSLLYSLIVATTATTAIMQ